jgi:hypothetical protein
MPTPVNDWLIALIVAVTPVVLSVIDYLFTLFGAKIPSWLKPILAMALGAAATFLAGLTIANPLIAALVGLAAAGIRQVIVWLGRAANIQFFQ